MSNKPDTFLMGMVWGTPLGKDPTNHRDSEYSSIPGPALNPLMILLKLELASGSALPRDKYNTGTILAISHQVMGTSPELIKVMSPYKVMLCYWEGTSWDQFQEKYWA